MKIKKRLLFIPLSLISNLGQAQTYWRDLETIKINKPIVAQLNNYEAFDDNVNLSTGEISPQINLTDIKTFFVSDNINLSYTKGKGIRVNDLSSDIGLGWEIVGGGSISRKVNGFADESKLFVDAAVGVWATTPSPTLNNQKNVNGWLDFANWNSKVYNTPFNGTVVLPGQPYENKALSSAIQEFSINAINNIYSSKFRSLLAQHLNAGIGMLGSGSTIADLASMAGLGWDTINVDGEPDEYYFNFGKYSGKFVFDGNKIPTTIPNIPGLKIESPFNSPSNQWVFTTPDGIKYYFSNTAGYIEKTYSETDTKPLYDDCFGPTPYTNEGIDVNEFVSKWYLTRVEGLSGDYINYTYEQVPDLIYSEKSYIKQLFRAGSGGAFSSIPPSYFLDSGDPGFYERLLPRTTNFRIKAPKRITTITSSDNNKILFKYEGIERSDIDQSQNGQNKRKSLSAVEKYDFNGTLIQRRILNQSFFQGSCNTYECKRLKLDNLTEVASGMNDIVTTFQYNISENLPQRNAFQQDYWGYYNDNTASTLIPTIPAIGNIGANRKPNGDKTAANILKKIVYPTKGSVEYEYELNSYNPLETLGVDPNNIDIPTGGLRIKNIIKRSGVNDPSPLISSYSYKLNNGKSSGQIPYILLKYSNNGAGKMYEIQFIEVNEDTGQKSRYAMIYSSPKDVRTDDILRYSDVQIKKTGKGQVEYLLSAFTPYNPFDTSLYKVSKEWFASQTNSGSYLADPSYFSTYTGYMSGDASPVPPNSINDLSYTRGLLLNEKVRDENGNLLSETLNTYEKNPQGYNPKTIYGVGVSSPYIFMGEKTRIGSVLFDINKYTSDFLFLKTKINKTFFSGQPIITTENYIYNPLCFLQNDNISYPDLNTTENNYLYSTDKQIQKLVDANVVGDVIEHQQKKNDKIVKKQEKKYDNPATLLPTSAISYDQNNTSSTDIAYDKYDNKGNLQQYTTKDGVSTTIIWGYNQTQPIAKIEGAKLSDIDPAVITNIVNASNTDAAALPNNDETSFLSSLKDFRNSLPNYQFTTYTYDPLIGVRSITPPSGIREVYFYDNARRLMEIREENQTGKLLKEFKYNYKN